MGGEVSGPMSTPEGAAPIPGGGGESASAATPMEGKVAEVAQEVFDNVTKQAQEADQASDLQREATLVAEEEDIVPLDLVKQALGTEETEEKDEIQVDEDEEEEDEDEDDEEQE